MDTSLYYLKAIPCYGAFFFLYLIVIPFTTTPLLHLRRTWHIALLISLIIGILLWYWNSIPWETIGWIVLWLAIAVGAVFLVKWLNNYTENLWKWIVGIAIAVAVIGGIWWIVNHYRRGSSVTYEQPTSSPASKKDCDCEIPPGRVLQYGENDFTKDQVMYFYAGSDSRTAWYKPMDIGDTVIIKEEPWTTTIAYSLIDTAINENGRLSDEDHFSLSGNIALNRWYKVTVNKPCKIFVTVTKNK